MGEVEILNFYNRFNYWLPIVVADNWMEGEFFEDGVYHHRSKLSHSRRWKGYH